MKSASLVAALVALVAWGAPVGAKRVESRRGLHGEVKRHSAVDKQSLNVEANASGALGGPDVPAEWFSPKWEAVWADNCDESDRNLIEVTSGLGKLWQDEYFSKQSDCAWMLTKLKSVEMGKSTWPPKFGGTKKDELLIGDVALMGNRMPPKNYIDWAETKDQNGVLKKDEGKFKTWAGNSIRVSVGDSAKAILDTLMGITAHSDDYNFMVLGQTAEKTCWKVEHTRCMFHGDNIGNYKAMIFGNPKP